MDRVRVEGLAVATLPRGRGGLGLAPRSLLDGAFHPTGLFISFHGRGSSTPFVVPAKLFAIFHPLFRHYPRDRPHHRRLSRLEVFAQPFVRRRLLLFTLRLSLLANDEFCLQNRQLPLPFDVTGISPNFVFQVLAVGFGVF